MRGHCREVAAPSGQGDGRAVKDGHRHDSDERREDHIAFPVAPAEPCSHGSGEETDQQILGPNGHGQGQDQGTGQVRAAIVDAAKKQGYSHQHQDDRRDIAECCPSEEPDIRKEGAEDPGNDRGGEAHADAASEEVDGWKEEEAADHGDALQSAKVSRRDEPHHLAERDEERKSRWMRMMLRDVVAAHPETEERLIPIPERTGDGQEPAQRASHGEGKEEPSLCRPRRIESSHHTPPEGSRAGAALSSDRRGMRDTVTPPVMWSPITCEGVPRKSGRQSSR